MRYQLGLWGLSYAILASGCSLEDVDSDAIRTQGIFADILALAPGDGSTLVRVQLTVGGDDGTNVTLVGDDRLEAQVGEITERLGRSGRGRYEQRISGDSPSEVSLRLLRGEENDPASASAQLPEGFMIALDTDSAAGISRGTPVIVSWTPPVSGGLIGWEVEGSCIWTESGQTPDDGSLTLAATTFRVRATQIGEDCEVQVTLDRQNDGVVDGVLIPGSRFRAIQRRRLSFASTPAAAELGVEPAPDAG